MIESSADSNLNIPKQKTKGAILMIRTHKMWEMTWLEVKQAVNDDLGIMLPIGSIEQHGHHLPLCTDSLIPTRLCLDMAEETNMIVAPPIMYATNSRPQSGGGQCFPGTTSIGGITFINELEDILREFMRHGFRKIVLFNWHMENSNFMYEAAWLASDKGTNKDVKILVMETPFDSFDKATMDFLYPDGFPGWGVEHAAMFETAILLHIAPELVIMDKAVDDRPEKKVFYDKLPIESQFTTKSGSLWKATLATKEKGDRIWQELKQTLIPIIKAEL